MSDSSPDDATPVEVPGVVDHRISEEEFLRDRPRNQLRLRHLFALMAVVAVLLTINRPQRIDFGNSGIKVPEAVHTLQAVTMAIVQLPAAVAITALGYGIAAYRRGDLFFNQPGHWLLVEVSLVSVLSLPIGFLTQWMQFRPNTAPSTTTVVVMIIFYAYIFLVLFLGRILINVFWGVVKCRQDRWRWVFFAKIAAIMLMAIGEVFVLVFLTMAIRRDRSERLLRDGSHWCGVYVQYAQSTLMIVYTFAMIVGVAVFVMTR